MVPRVWRDFDIYWPADGRAVMRREDLIRAIEVFMGDVTRPLLVEMPSDVPGLRHAYLVPPGPGGVGGDGYVEGAFFVGCSTQLGLSVDDLGAALERWWLIWGR